MQARGLAPIVSIEFAATTITNSMQQQFADLSGDRNPMHMDVLAARRTQAGAPVVHGVHLLLNLLEQLCTMDLLPLPSVRLRCRFLKWVYVGDTVTWRTLPLQDADRFILEGAVDGLLVLTLDLARGEPAICNEAVAGSTPALSNPLQLGMEELEGKAGHAFVADLSARKAFPALCERLSPALVSEIAACSYVVGMQAPGLHSTFTKLDISLCAAAQAAAPALRYEVVAVDTRFRKARIAVHGTAFSGAIEAFVRHPPVQQPGMAAVTERVGPGEFADVRALIVGGSRGLGELTARCIVSGGGACTLTYAQGESDALRLAEELGGNAEVLRYDVRRPPAPQLAAVHGSFTHLFYFATNAIFRPKARIVSPQHLADFAAFYLQGFHDLCEELVREPARLLVDNKPLAVYYPSSVAVTERPAGMTEYAMMKAAGEEMCRDMNQHMPRLRILTTRLPRLSTDQTASLSPERGSDTLAVLLPILRQMMP